MAKNSNLPFLPRKTELYYTTLLLNFQDTEDNHLATLATLKQFYSKSAKML